MAVSPPPSEAKKAPKMFKDRSSNRVEQNDQNVASAASGPPQKIKRRKKSPGVRIVGRRIYDSHHGKTCHQCRQKTMDFVATCKKNTGKKQCTFHFCQKCLLNRYGEKAEDMACSNDWICPRCRGICNCSLCMKKKGHHPTGILIHAAKANGFSSVSEMLHHGDLEILWSDKTMRDDGNKEKDNTRKRKSSNKEGAVASAKLSRKEIGFQARCKLEFLAKLVESGLRELEKSRYNGASYYAHEGDGSIDCVAQKSSPLKHQISKEAYNKREKMKNGHFAYPLDMHDDILAEHHSTENLYRSNRNLCMKVESVTPDSQLLPSQGFELRNQTAFDPTAEDVGHALRFLEFCEAVGKEPALVRIRKRGNHSSFERQRELELQDKALEENCLDAETIKGKAKRPRNKDVNGNASIANSRTNFSGQNVREAFRRTKEDSNNYSRDDGEEMVGENSDAKVGPETHKESRKEQSVKTEVLDNANHDYSILELKSIALSHRSIKKIQCKYLLAISFGHQLKALD